MKNRTQHLFVALTLLSALNLQPSTAFVQCTAFVYQGRLNDGGVSASGMCSLAFSLYTANNGSTHKI